MTAKAVPPAFSSPDPVSRTYILCALGLLTGFGPYVTDLYLSVLPAQAVYFFMKDNTRRRKNPRPLLRGTSHSSVPAASSCQSV